MIPLLLFPASLLLPVSIYLLGCRKVRVTGPFACGYSSSPQRVGMKFHRAAYAFLLIIFEEFLLIIVLVSPQSIGAVLFYAITAASALVMLR